MAKFCEKCGAKLDETTGLCPRCDAENASEKNADNTTESAHEPDDQSGRTGAEKKRRTLTKVIVAEVLVIVLAAGAVLAFMCFGGTSGKESALADNTSGSSVTGLTGEFTEREITDADTAAAAAQDAAEELGYGNALDELELCTESNVGDECFYRLQQYYNGIPVYGRYVTVVAASDGEARSITSDAQDVEADISMTAALSDAQLSEAIHTYAEENWDVVYDDMSIPELSDDLLVVYDQSGEARLAYELTVVNGVEYTVVADANTGEILESVLSVSDLTGTNADGTQSFPVMYDEASDTYTMGDDERGIYVYDLDKNSGLKRWNKKTEITSVGDSIFGNTAAETAQSPELAINLIDNVEQIADYFKTKFNQDIPYGKLTLFYNDGSYDGKNAFGGTADGESGLLSVGYALDCTQMDVLTHEYTHIIQMENALTLGSSSSFGISEGLADTFACFYTGTWDVDLTGVGGTHRNAEDPTQYEYPDSIDDVNESDEADGHAYATVISHAAYLMSKSGAFSNDELQMLWYKTMLRLPFNCLYGDLRYCMVQTAKASGHTKEQRSAIADAFDEAGIYDTWTYERGNTFEIGVYDKQGEHYDDYTVLIDGETAGGLFGIGSKKYETQITQQSADACEVELEDGEYTITVVDNANKKTTKTFSVVVEKSYATDAINAFGFGADYTVARNAALEILDAYGDTFEDLTDITVTASYGDESNTIEPENIDLAEANYYRTVIAQRVEDEGVTYYERFTLRVKDGTNDSASVQTAFLPADAVPRGLEYEIDVTTQSVTITGYTGIAKKLKIPDEIEGYPVTVIGFSAFDDSESLTSITIPSSVKYIETWNREGTRREAPLGGTGSLTSIDVDPANTAYSSVDGVLFDKSQTTLLNCPCGKSGACVIPDGVTTIGDLSFSDCDNLTSITISASVTDIGEYFYDGFEILSSLTDITVDPANTMYSSLNGVLYDKEQTELIVCPPEKEGECVIPASVTRIEDHSSHWESRLRLCPKLTDITVESANTVYSSLDGVLYNKERSYLINYPAAKSETEYIVPNGVTNIADFAFYRCSNLTSVTISDGVQYIGDCAFESCSALTEIFIPGSTTWISGSAFDGCSSLTSITLKGTEPPEFDDTGDYIEPVLFDGCPAITVHVPAASLTAYEKVLASILPEGSKFVTENGDEIPVEDAKIAATKEITISGKYSSGSSWEETLVYKGVSAWGIGLFETPNGDWLLPKRLL